MKANSKRVLVHFRATEEEVAQWLVLARARGQTLSAWLRAVLGEASGT